MDLGVGTPALWGGFLVFVLAMLALDLGVFHRASREVRFKEALAWSGVWVTLALAFGAGVTAMFGPERGLEFLAGYVVEKSLSVDNIFVFVVIFSAFAVPRALQHRVLFWGILGALILRAVFIVAGVALLERFHWMIYVFGGLLAVTGVRMLVRRGAEPAPEESRAVAWLKRRLPTTAGFRSERFLVREGGRWLATPLLLALVAVEATDVVFAVDSIPAVFAVTRDPFIVFTSNIFAILGLRAMYFLLADVVHRFHHLKVGLSLVLVFVGGKMLLADVAKVPVAVSLGVITLLVGGSIVTSLLRPAPRPAVERKAG